MAFPPSAAGAPRRCLVPILLLVALAALLLAPPSLAAEQRARPNVVVIVADDQGYRDLGCQGCKDIPTPHIDSLAKNGIRCTHGYVSGPYCSPTRAGLLTGRYQQRFGHEFNPGPPGQASEAFGLALEEATLAERLRAAGYATGMVGKWHLGYEPRFHPLKRGFDEFFGFLGGAHSYVNWDVKNQPILRGTQPVVESTYLTDAFGREAVAFLERHAKGSKPFFLYWTFNAVHTPLEAPPKYLERFAAIQDPKRRTYAAMLSAMDDAVGQFLARLREQGQEENTLIFYISDNGGPPVNASDNTPLRGYKAQTLEGGIRVPFLVQWKGTLPAGKTYDQPVIQLDILPTALAAAGVKLPSDAKRLDGVNLLPYLTGAQAGPPHEALYWRFGQQMAIRQGDWKLVRHSQGKTAELYNLAEDVGESRDLAAARPEKVKELQAAYASWNSELVPPRWTPPAQKAKAKAKAKAKTGK